jgi:Flp pilus assembly protein TadG
MMADDRRSERGQSLVEYALILPVLMLLLVGIMEFAVVSLNYTTVANAAREGARAGAVVSGNNSAIAAAAEEAAEQASDTLQAAQRDVEVTVSTEVEQVRVEYDAQLITGGFIAALGGRLVDPLQAVSTSSGK